MPRLYCGNTVDEAQDYVMIWKDRGNQKPLANFAQASAILITAINMKLGPYKI